MRKRSLEFDDVMNKQREVVYSFRNEGINAEDPRPLIWEVIDEAIPPKVEEYLKPETATSQTTWAFCIGSTQRSPWDCRRNGRGFESMTVEQVSASLIERVKKSYEVKCSHEEAGAVRYPRADT